MPLDPIRLPDRARRMLAVFRRHPALTPAAFQALACPEDSMNAVFKAARRLGYAGWLETHKLPSGGVYYLPTRRAARALGLPRRRRLGLSHDGLVQYLGMLSLCLKTGVQKRPAADIKAALPTFFRRGLASTGYGVASDARLVWLVIDHRTKPSRLAYKAAAAVAEREMLPAFRDFIDAGGFGVIIGVPTAAKAGEVEAALEPLTINRFVAVSVVVLPDLGPLLLNGD